ncbi:MAG: winged helix DNA-binding domain-containing protein [Chloroflexota bacterium]|nr:winged helix DNA-binding domain-containing protein [Chloroflexota bacterium]
MEEAPLNLEQVNRFLLSKQHLAPGTQGDDVVRVVEDICALHATAATTPYLSLWSRMEGFSRQQLEAELYEKRGLVRTICMRSTLHIVPAERLPTFFQATKERLQRDYSRQAGRLLVQAGLCREGEEAETLGRLHRRVADALAGRGPATVSVIGGLVPELKSKVKYNVDRPYGGEFSLGSRLVAGMCTLGLLVRAKPRGSWRSNLYEYALLADWLSGMDLEILAPEEAQTRLVRWYLAAFGPSTVEDIAWWSGFGKVRTREALSVLDDELVEVEIEGLGGCYLMLAADHQRLHETRLGMEPSANLLPTLDPYIMGYKDRRRFLAPEHYDRVFDRAGNALATVWANGQVVGIWQEQEAAIELLLLRDVEGEVLASVEATARRLGCFLGGQDVEVVVKPYT